MIVEPGFFRTELLTPESTTFGELSIDDYDEARAADQRVLGLDERHAGRRPGQARPGARPARRLRLSRRCAGSAGEDVVEGVEDKARLLLAQVDAHRELSTSLAHEDAKAAA